MEVNIVTDGNIYHNIEIYSDSDYVYMEGYKAAEKEKMDVIQLFEQIVDYIKNDKLSEKEQK